MASLLPIVHRELLMASRRRGTYWTRCCTAMLVGGVLFAMSLGIPHPAASVSPMIFWALKVITFTYCLLAGVCYTADALSEERREGTLGLLFLTDLRGYDVVIGKLAVTSLNAFLGLLSAIPLLAVPVMMGGLSMAEVWRLNLVLFNTLCFSLAVGLVVSAFGMREGNVALATLACVLMVTFGLPLLWDTTTRFSHARWLEFLLLFPSPAYALKISASGLFAAVPGDFWKCMITIASISLGCIVTASLRLPRSFQEPSQAPEADGRHSRRQRLTFGSASVRARVRKHLLRGRPYLWRVSRDRTMGSWCLLLALVATVFGLYTAIVISDSLRRRQEPILFLIWLVAHWVVKVLVTAEACRPFTEDKRTGALELLLCTPLRPADMIAAQRRRLQGLFWLPVLVVCGANYLIALATAEKVMSTIFCLGMFTLLADCWALQWTGWHLSMAGRSFTRAVTSTLWRVMMPGWVAFFAVVLLLMAGRASESTLLSFLVMWTIGSVIYDSCLVTSSRFTLGRDFRRFAADERSSKLVQQTLGVEMKPGRAAAAFP